MTSRIRDTTFWHLGDLHLCEPCVPRCAAPPAKPAKPACHPCIRAVLLDRLSKQLARERPDLVLLAGDIFEDRSKETYSLLERFEANAKASGSTLVGVRGQHDPSRAALAKRFDWFLSSGATADVGAVTVFGLPCESAKNSWPVRFAQFNPGKSRKPAVLLAHANVVHFPARERTAPRFRYYALGDKHQVYVERLPSGAVLGNPGHIHSYWDGSGKAWPVFFLRGRISAEGRVTVEAVSLERAPYFAPPTRQLYVPFEHRRRRAGWLVLVHAPDDSSLRRVGLVPDSVDSILSTVDRKRGKPVTGAETRRALFSYRDPNHLRHLISSIVSGLPNDVFVSPSTGKGWANRVKDYGAHLVNDRLEELVEKTFMREAKTLTSDYEVGTPRIRG